MAGSAWALEEEQPVEEIEEIVVTSSHTGQALSEIESPLHVVSGDDIANAATSSLGESLDSLLGVASTDYGAAVGQPVIRGMSGNRVKILNNGTVVRDVSGLGTDHINDIDLHNIQQIEVVRGPSSLLYANGTIGGIINIVDNTIARKDFAEPVFGLGLESQSVNDGSATNFSYQGNLSGFNLSVGLKDAQFGNFDIPDGAVLHSEEEADEADPGFIADSDHESAAQKFGLSRTGDWGYVGLSFSNIESLYGIPFHGEEHGHEEPEGTEEHEEEGERIFSTTDSQAFNLAGSYAFPDGLVERVDYHYRSSDYALTEQHAAAESEPAEAPTRFENQASEYGAIIDMGGALPQKLVFNLAAEDISIIGAEAYMNPTQSDELSVGYYLSADLPLLHFDLGLRYDWINRKGSVSNREKACSTASPAPPECLDRGFDIRSDNVSLAMSLGKVFGDGLDVHLGFASVARAPSAVELFINGPHLATGRFEVGNGQLDSERSNNIDIVAGYESNGFHAILTLFRNDVNNYIYLLDEAEDEHDEHEGEDEHEGLILANYLQQDAELAGHEFEVGYAFALGRGKMGLSFGRDYIAGQFGDGTNIPRMIPARSIYTVSYAEDALKATVTLKDVRVQNDVAPNETATAGYQMLDFNLTQSFRLNEDIDLDLSVFANNLLNEVARNSSSFVKDEVPLPGRNYGVKLNLRF